MKLFDSKYVDGTFEDGKVVLKIEAKAFLKPAVDSAFQFAEAIAKKTSMKFDDEAVAKAKAAAYAYFDLGSVEAASVEVGSEPAKV